jgi:hemoglobin
MTPAADIASRGDVERLVDAFYETVRGDALLGPIFDEVARVNWERHLPKMYDFWEGVLLGGSSFRGNPLAVHIALAARVPLGPREFNRWLALFHQAVDASFCGPIADEAKARASRIAAVMQYHIAGAAAATGLRLT